MSNWIKLTWYYDSSFDPIVVRVNADKIEYYHYETYGHSTKNGIIDGSTVKFNDRHLFVLEKPSEIDNLISSPMTNKLAKWSEND